MAALGLGQPHWDEAGRFSRPVTKGASTVDGKTLYFEDAGSSTAKYGDLGTCRIRTAFHDETGTAWYLELEGYRMTDAQRKQNPDAPTSEFVGTATYFYEITGSHDDVNEHRHPAQHGWLIPWTAASVLGLVNNQLGCNFEAIQVLPDLAGYRVHAGQGRYNFGDAFVYDPASTARVEEIVAREEGRQRAAGERWPLVRAWRDQDDPGLLHVKHLRGGFGELCERIDSESPCDIPMSTRQQAQLNERTCAR